MRWQAALGTLPQLCHISGSSGKGIATCRCLSAPLPCRECIVLSKRLLIEGEGALGETIIDQRANCPTFRITRGGVVLRNLDLDQTGFREALLVTGGATVRPLLEGCVLKCSGDDVLNIGGAAHPLLRRCTLSGKKCGVRAFGTARGRLEQCVVEKCGEQGLKAMEGAAPELTRCELWEGGWMADEPSFTAGGPVYGDSSE